MDEAIHSNGVSIEEVVPELQSSKMNFEEDIERGIVNFFINDRDFFARNYHQIKPFYFNDEVRSEIIEVVSKYFDKYQVLPGRSVLTSLFKDRYGNDLDFLSKIMLEIDEIYEIYESVIENKDYVQKIVNDFCLKEALKKHVRDSCRHIANHKMDCSEKLRKVSESLEEASLVGEHDENFIFYYENYKERYEEGFSGDIRRTVPTGFGGIDQEIDGGLGKGEVGVFLGQPGSGKSVVLVNVAANLVLEGKNVLFISLENHAEVVQKRFDSCLSSVEFKMLNVHKKDVLDKLDFQKEHFGSENLVIKEYPLGTVVVEDFMFLVQRLRTLRGWSPDAVVIDYLDEMQAIKNEKKYVWHEERLRQLRKWASSDGGFCVFTATQTNREGRYVDTIDDRHLGDSYGKFRIADCMWSLNLKEEEKANDVLRIYVVKHRNGRAQYIVYCRVDFKTMKMVEISQEEYDQIMEGM